MQNSTSAPRHYNRESGNVLFLILIAVALFAFLSYVVSSSTRSSGAGVGEDSTTLRASQIIQYATYVEQAVLRMRFREIQAEEFCFDHDAWGHNDYYYSACDDIENQVFSTHPDGGGVSFVAPPRGANDGSSWYFPANVCVDALGISTADGCDSDGSNLSEDLVMVLPNVSYEVCVELNKMLSIRTADGEPPQAAGNLFDAGMPLFTGTFADGGRIDSGGSDASVLRGQNYGCVEGNGVPAAGTYHYFHVLLPR